MIAPSIVFLTWLVVFLGPLVYGSTFGWKYGWTKIDVVWSGVAFAIAVACHIWIQRRIVSQPSSVDPEIEQLRHRLRSCNYQCIAAVVVIFVIYLTNVATWNPLSIALALSHFGVLIWCAHLTVVLVTSLFHQTSRFSDRAVLAVAAINLSLLLGYHQGKNSFLGVD